MQYEDRVFGVHTIEEPIILELLETKAMQRLRGIDQSGYPHPFFPELVPHSRFEHSVGVYLLLKKYNASLYEQISGLLHDLSHTVFSHCGDYLLGDCDAQKEQTHHDLFFSSFLLQTDVPRVLEKYGFSAEDFFDDTNFPLREKLLPDLCADRIDYALRTAVSSNKWDGERVQSTLSRLQVEENQWIFSDLEAAREYGQLFAEMNTNYYTHFLSVVMHYAVTECLRYCLEQSYIRYDDLYTTDAEVLDKVKRYLDDPRLVILFARMHDATCAVHDPDQFHEKIFCKSRVVDPLCYHRGEVVRLSFCDPSWERFVREERHPKVYSLRFVESVGLSRM